MFLYQLVQKTDQNSYNLPYKTSIHDTHLKRLTQSRIGVSSGLELTNGALNLKADVFGAVNFDNLKLQGTGSVLKGINNPDSWFVEARGEYKIPIKNIISPALELNALLVGSAAFGQVGNRPWQQAMMGAGLELKVQSSFNAKILLMAPVAGKGVQPGYSIQGSPTLSIQIEVAIKLSEHTFLEIGVSNLFNNPYSGSFMFTPSMFLNR